MGIRKLEAEILKELKENDIIIFDNTSGRCVNLPTEKILLNWNKKIEKLFPIEGTYWAVGIVRKASDEEKSTVRFGNQ